MFEITGDDIAALGDADLRSLVGLLCEAELRCRGLPTSAVTWGGHQNAKDGGLDVLVTLPAGTEVVGFIPKPQTGFQVKKPDMPRAEILEEMKPTPAKVLRPVIGELADASGAYIIVSASGSTSASALTNRRGAMTEAIEGTSAEGKLALDFYDRNRIATWVRDHAGMIPWVRSRIGKAVPGWQSYGSWSHSPEGADAGYLADNQARIYTGDKDDGDGISAVEGINRIRKILCVPGHVVRLIGLSGVGKTRLAEALFDSGLGERALDPSLAIFTNIADEPDPAPTGLASDLIAAQTRAILVIDNCAPELHRQLSEIARSKNSTISVITIEYDIREDQPEGTDVFVLDTSSQEVVEKLVSRRYPELSQIDVHTVAEFSGGNARLALALASRIEKTETVAGLSEEELFRRLFQQRHDPDPWLLLVAQACSLVYSFEGESLSEDDAELPVLGGLIGKTPEEIYSGVAELRRRDLVQARARWRAVLPHAIANRLAKLALQNIPLTRIETFADNASGRILRSFSRRIGYLDDSKEARSIAQKWLAPGGLLGEIANLNELGREMFCNIAPVVPEAVLSGLENVLSDADEATLRRCSHFAWLLRSLAYEADFFTRAVTLLTKLAALPTDHGPDSEAAEMVESLFYITLSGTHAPIKLRAKVVEELLGSKDSNIRALGSKAFGALLKTGFFSSHYEFNFGARSRNYGYSPKNSREVRAWFDVVLKLASKLALLDGPVAGDVRNALAQEFRSLWSNTDCAADLDRLAREIAAKSFWRDGWIATRQLLTYDGKTMSPELRTRLIALEEFLRPKDLVSKVRGLVIGQRSGSLDLDGFEETEDTENEKPVNYAARAARAAAAIRDLGLNVAVDEGAFKTLLPELIRNDGRPVVSIFGAALAEGVENPQAMWEAMVQKVAETKQNGLRLLGGFLSGLQKRDKAVVEAILDVALEDPDLGASFPTLQAGLTMDKRALERLHQALDLEKAPMSTFYALAYGQACDGVSGSELRDLVGAIAGKPDGCPVALEIITMRLHSDRSAGRETLPEVREAGRMVLEKLEFHKSDRAVQLDHELGIVVRMSLVGEDGAAVVRRLCRKLMAAAAKYEVSASDYDDLIKGLLKVHPSATLDELLSNIELRHHGVRILRNVSRSHKAAFDVISDESLIVWCNHEPAERYPIAASVVPIFKQIKDDEPQEWTSLVTKLLAHAPDPSLVLKELVKRLYPSSWSGSYASILETRLRLLTSLPGGDSPALAAVMAEAKTDLEARVARERRHETEEGRSRNNRFE